jgi:peptide/nickel transport system substrate-binding protein
VGTGAFILRDKDDTRAIQVRNPDYWKAGLPYLDGVNMVWIQEQQSAFAAFLAGQLDIVQVPGEQSKKFLAERGSQYFTAWSPGVNCWVMSPNLKVKPFDDPRVTRALRLMIDHQEAVKAWAEVYFGNGTSWILPHAMEPWDLPADEYAKILEWKQPKDEAAREAVALLSAAGFNRSNPLKFKIVNNNEPATGQVTAQLVQGMWQKYSQGVVQAELELVDNATSRTRQATGQFENSGPIGRGSYYDPDQYLTQQFHSKGNVNYSKWSDAKLDDMIDKERTIFDTNQRKAAVKEIVRYVIENAPQVTFASRDILNATQPKVKDFLPEPGRWPGWQYERIWLDV